MDAYESSEDEADFLYEFDYTDSRDSIRKGLKAYQDRKVSAKALIELSNQHSSWYFPS